jgi:hypothetical protein
MLGKDLEESRFGVNTMWECWRKISILRQAHSKPNKAGLTHVSDPKRASQFFWNWQKKKGS